MIVATRITAAASGPGVDANFGAISEIVDRLLNGFLTMLPLLAVAIFVFVLLLFAARPRSRKLSAPRRSWVGRVRSKGSAGLARLRAYERWLSARSSAPARFAEGPWRLDGRAWLASLVRTVRGAGQDDYGLIAGAIAFSAFLGLLPLLAAVALIYGMVTPYDRVIENIRELLFILPTDARAFIGDWLVNAITRREGRDLSLSIAVAIALAGALRAGRSVIAGLNTASEVDRRRGFVHRGIVALLIVLCGGILVLGALFAISAFAWIEHVLPTGLAAALPALQLGFWSLMAVSAAGTMAWVYRHAPHRPPPRWRWMMPGALAATLLWLAATLVFAAYLNSFGMTDRTYGSIGAIIVLLLWLFLSGYAMLLGAKLNTEIMRSAGIEALAAR